jgi:GTP-binding protein
VHSGVGSVYYALFSAPEATMTAIRNIAIIAHVDHGKTTLVDQILKQANLFRDPSSVQDCFLDSNDLERERGITILSKNISVRYRDTKINVIDTPGHSDFGGQVERVLNMADGVLLLVDAAEGPMPQTRFVLDKALAIGLKPLVVINKIDKPDARPDAVLDMIFDLFVDLDANDEQLEFSTLYASGRSGWACRELEDPRDSILPLMDAIIDDVPPPRVHEGPVQIQVNSLDYSEYVGRIAIGRVHRGILRNGQVAVISQSTGVQRMASLRALRTFEGLDQVEAESVGHGDLCAIVGIPDIEIGDTITDPEHPEALPPIAIDEPTLSMLFRVNDGPLYGQEGKFLSSRHLRERLFKELERDVALRVTEGDGDSFEVCGRGLLHLSILLETMRREGYECTVSRPHVISRIIEGKRCEPIEILRVDTPSESSGKVIELIGTRRGEMHAMTENGSRTELRFEIPTRGLLGLRSRLMTASAGEAVVSHRFDRYDHWRGDLPARQCGVLISMSQGEAIAYAIDALQLRGSFFVSPGEKTYEGMIVAEHCRPGDLVVNLQKGKQLTNVRASGTDRSMQITPAIKLSLEEALEYVEEDELVEVTPLSIRIRKRLLTEVQRKRAPKS